jgi:hypothetical protein
VAHSSQVFSSAALTSALWDVGVSSGAPLCAQSFSISRSCARTQVVSSCGSAVTQTPAYCLSVRKNAVQEVELSKLLPRPSPQARNAMCALSLPIQEGRFVYNAFSTHLQALLHPGTLSRPDPALLHNGPPTSISRNAFFSDSPSCSALIWPSSLLMISGVPISPLSVTN